MAAATLQIINMGIGIILPRVMLVFFGSEINGLFSSITQFIAYLTLVEAGISGSVIFYLYKPLSEKNYLKINSIINAARLFYVKTGVIFILLMILLAIIYPLFIKTDLLSYKEVFLLVLIIGMSGVLDFFVMAKYRVLLTADQKTYVISIATIVSNLFNVLIITILAFLKFDIVMVRFYAIFSILLRSAILYTYTKIKYAYVDFKVKPDNSALNKRWDAFYLQLLGVFHNGIPIVMASIFTSLKTVSIYTIYMVAISGIRGLFSIFDSGLASGFGEVVSKNDKKTLQKAYLEFEFIYYFIITTVYSVSIFLIGPFIKIYTAGIKDVDYTSEILCFLFVFNAFCYNLKNPQGMMVISAGLYKETRIQSTIQAGILTFGCIILAPKYGLVGILIASILSDIYRIIDLMFFIPKNVTHLSYKVTLKRIITFSSVFLLLSYIANKINFSIISSIHQWILAAIYSTVIIFVLVFIVAILLDKNEINNLKYRIHLSVKGLFHVS